MHHCIWIELNLIIGHHSLCMSLPISGTKGTKKKNFFFFFFFFFLCAAYDFMFLCALMALKFPFFTCFIFARFTCVPCWTGGVARDNGCMPFRCFMLLERCSQIRPVSARTTNIFCVRENVTRFLQLLHLLLVRGRFLMFF